MAMPFDSEMLVSLGWRQGSILGPELARLAREYAPARVVVDDADRFIVTSHICGIGRFCKERGYSVIPVRSAPEPSDFDRAVRQLLNPEYEPIELTGEDESPVAVVAELIEVIGTAPPLG